MTAGVTGERWSRRDAVALAGVFLAGILVRAALLPTDGFRPDLDQFVLWVHGIATNGLGDAYRGDLAFGPVVAVIWGGLAAVEPAFRTATDASDPAIRVLMKVPPTLADFGIAALVVASLRSTPCWAIVGAAAILLHPAVLDVGAWWGQYESVYVLWGLAALFCAVRDRTTWAAVFVALAVLSKPQAVAFVLPIVAWVWARSGIRGLVSAGVAGIATAVVAWLPFLAAGGPADYLHTLTVYQVEIFNVLSLRAWNAWWLVQEAHAGGRFLADDVAVIGPVTLRQLGYAVAGLGSLAIALAIVRRPTPRALALGMAASSLVLFMFLTGMHERYGFAALAVLALCVPDGRLRWIAVALGLVMTANLLAAIPPSDRIGNLLPIAGPLGIFGSIAMLAITGAILSLLIRESQDDRATVDGGLGGLSSAA